jgi:AraC-like DNA-binding protein
VERNFNQKLLEIVEDNLSDENFGPEQLAASMGLSYSSLHRRVKENFNKTLSQLLREKRLELAKEILQNEDFSVAEVAYKVGFGSPSYFNKCFHEHFGVAPGVYRKGEEVKSKERPILDFIIEIPEPLSKGVVQFLYDIKMLYYLIYLPFLHILSSTISFVI